MTVATKIAAEIVRFQPENPRWTELFRMLAASAPDVGISLQVTPEYLGGSEWLLLWGPGNPARAEALKRHVMAGGRVLAFDLAYWQRNQKVRVSFDAPHPQRFVMRKTLPSDRFVNDGVVLTNDWDPDGPIVIAGLGEKARVQYGAGTVDEWEADMMRACSARWQRRIVYRPKKADSPVPRWASHVSREPVVDDALRGASLVITWHSNVAVDAIRIGIPVVCRDGAAAAVCPGAIGSDHRPMPEEWRRKFLGNLAWFQWRPDEAPALWRFATEMLS